MIRVVAQQGTIKTIQADLLVCFLFEDNGTIPSQLATLHKLFGEDLVPPGGTIFNGKPRETLLLFPKKLRSPRLLLVGLGKTGELSAERIRRGASTAARVAQECSVQVAAVVEPDPAVGGKLAGTPGDVTWEMFGVAVTEGILLGLYKYDHYLTKDGETRTPPSKFLIATESPSRLKSIARGIKQAVVICDATNLARDLENAPGNELHPESLAQAARRSGRRSGYRVKVLNEKQIRALKMGGLLGVAQGSTRPPRFIIMEYRGRHARKGPVVFVGKGVTFDAGGISIKPAAGMSEMKMDMSGAAAVIGTMQAAATLKLPVHLIGLVPATENLLGGSAFKPGDILRHRNGLTSEIDNTDAEGRLILADALTYASRYSPALVIDLATLTGAVVVALGHFATGMMGNDPEAMRQLKEAGDRTYERVWELPMFEEYEALIRSDVADVKNTGGRWGGAITAAMFLRKFIGPYPWVHLDIAGTAILEESSAYTPRGGSGVGVRLLIDFLKNRNSQ